MWQGNGNMLCDVQEWGMVYVLLTFLTSMRLLRSRFGAREVFWPSSC